MAPLAVIVSGFLLMGCHENSPLTPKPEPQSGNVSSKSQCSGNMVSWKTFKKGQRSSYSTDQNRVIVNNQQLQAVWGKLNLPQSAPQVNFKHYIVIGAFQGPKPSSGFCISIQELCGNQNQLTVKIQNTTPKSGCAVQNVQLNPYHLVKVKRSALPKAYKNLNVSFNEASQKTCGKCSNNPPAKPCKQLPYHEIYKNQFSGIKQAQEKVIRTQNAFDKLWQKVHHRNTNGSKPKVDFQQQMVLALFQGEKNRGGYRLAVTDVCKKNKNLAVTLEHRQPGQGCVGISAINQPSKFVTVPKVKGSVKFDIKTVTRKCHK